MFRQIALVVTDDGVLFQHYVQGTCNAAEFMKPDYIFADDEFW